jgi:hypothetical protein
VSEGIGIRLLNGWWEPGEGCCTRTEIIPRASRAGIPQRGHDLAGLSKNMVVASIFISASSSRLVPLPKSENYNT